MHCFLMQSDHSRSKMNNNNNNNNTSSLTKPPPDSPGPRQRPRRELFENWSEYVDQTSGRPFYYNNENRAKSWKPPRRIGTSPITRVSFFVFFFLNYCFSFFCFLILLHLIHMRIVSSFLSSCRVLNLAHISHLFWIGNFH